MNYISVNCEECNEQFITIKSSNCDFSINYDEKNIINIIDSNYITYLEICEHNLKALKKLLDGCARIFIEDDNYISKCCKVLNCNYLINYGKFFVNYNNDKSILGFYEYSCNDPNEIVWNVNRISDDEFLSKIKFGSILISALSENKFDVLKLFIENNTNFILKKIMCPFCTQEHIIERSVSTKPAIKQ